MTVLVCTDFSLASAAGEREAARRFPRARLVVFHAVSPQLATHLARLTGMDGVELRVDMLEYADQRLSETVDRLVSQGHTAIACLEEGDPVERVLASAERFDADIIVVGVTRDESVGRFRTCLGRHTARPLLLIPSEG